MIGSKKILAFACLSVLPWAGSAFAQTEPTTQGNSQTLTATITGVEGNVQEREDENSPWQKALVGMELNENGELRTGPRSAVRFTLPGGQTITLDRLGVIKILTAVEQNGKITTDLGLKYGRTRYDIKKAGVQYSSTIRSPGSTLAIRGTDVTYEDTAPWAPNAYSIEGRAQFKNGHNQFISFGGTSHADIDSNHQSPGDVAFEDTNDDPRTDFSGHDPIEEKIITEYPFLSVFEAGSGGSLLPLLQSTQAASESIQTTLLTGPLEFNLAWASVNYSAGNANPTNLDLSVGDSAGNTVGKDTSTVVSSTSAGTYTAVYSGDDKGLHGTGAESIIYTNHFPQGTFAINVANISGDPAQAIVTVERNNQTLKTIGASQQNPLILQPGQTFTTSIDVGAGADTDQGVTSSAVVKHKHR
ncbi:MAG TPA: hypothetical protein VGG19_00795 [Tepidisphaeraceae bacterium]|jgi:hypothetical protein